MPTAPEETNYTRSTDTQSATAATQISTIPTHANRIVTSFIATLGEYDSRSPHDGTEETLLSGYSQKNIKRELFKAVSQTLEAENSRLEFMGKSAGSMDNVMFTATTIIEGGDLLLLGNLRA
ncbi:hypothetical protein B9479_004187 [Cryptococcus floricola]|uniref:Uncharacterized protein n=1 Tax=Cryptococcus floricola TaxID=2591691 RepID=A0A5D3AXU4_9TREE|nr:hypothetical protein B9479_004187 [Cryptococcus floricola]